MKRVFIAAAAIVLSVSATEVRAELSATGSTGTFRDAFVQKPEGFDQVRRTHMGNPKGFKALCDAEMESPPDMVFASRAIKDEEAKACGSIDIQGEMVARNGLIFLTGEDSPLKALTLDEIFLALAARVPDPNDDKALMNNPYKKWSDINPDLPDVEIRIAGPSRNVFSWSKFIVQTVRYGCMKFDAYRDLERNDYRGWFQYCGDVRKDGPYMEIGKKFKPDEMVSAQPSALMVAAYLASPTPKAGAKIDAKGFKVVPVDGVTPTPQNIADGSYKLGTDMIVYARKDTLKAKPGIKKLIEGFKEIAGRFGLRYFEGVY